MPLAGTEVSTAIDARRANHALYYLYREHAIRHEDVLEPKPVQLRRPGPRSHPRLSPKRSRAPRPSPTPSQSTPLTSSSTSSSRRFASPAEPPVEAARLTVASRHATLNLLGGFHHAAPARGVGFSAVNDVAVATAVLRAQGFTGRIGVIDLDAHPPDGTAECLKGDPSVWIGSISGVSWGPLPNVDDVVLPKGTGDGDYLDALSALLSRMPQLELAFVVAGGDVLVGDKLGQLGLSVAGARARDLRVITRLEAQPQVWLTAGGYGPHAWKVLAGSGLALAFHTDAPIPSDFDPLGSEMAAVAMELDGAQLGNTPELSEDDFPELYGRRSPVKLLDFYTRDGIEYALERYGILPLVRRLGFSDLHVEVDARSLRLKCLEAVLIECEVERKAIAGGEFLFVNWLSLRNPRAQFSDKRPQLPGARKMLGLESR